MHIFFTVPNHRHALRSRTWRWALANRKDAGLYHQGPVLLHHPRAGLCRAEICAAVPDALSGSVSYCLYPETRYQLGDTNNKAWAQAPFGFAAHCVLCSGGRSHHGAGYAACDFLPRYFLRAAAGVRHGCGPGAEFAAGHTGKLGDGPEPHADGFCGKRRQQPVVLAVLNGHRHLHRRSERGNECGRFRAVVPR